jgi:hypothetical protein
LEAANWVGIDRLERSYVRGCNPAGDRVEEDCESVAHSRIVKNFGGNVNQFSCQHGFYRFAAAGFQAADPANGTTE